MWQLTQTRSITHNGDPPWCLFWLTFQRLDGAATTPDSDTSWCWVSWQLLEVRRPGWRPRPRTAPRPILILGTAWSIDTWAEHVVKIRATAGDLDKHVTLSERITASHESDTADGKVRCNKDLVLVHKKGAGSRLASPFGCIFVKFG